MCMMGGSPFAATIATCRAPQPCMSMPRQPRISPTGSRTTASADGAENLTGGVSGFVRREQYIEGGKFGGLAGTAHRRFGAELGQLCGTVPAAHLQWRPDRARRDRVHANALARELLRQYCGEDRDGRLRRGKVQQVWRWGVGVDGGGIDDGSAGRHVLECRLREPEHGIDIRLVGGVQLLRRNVKDRVLRRLACGIVDKDVQATKLRHG